MMSKTKKLVLGQHSNLQETKTTEFKEFYLKITPDTIFSEKKSKDIMLKGSFSNDFNNLVLRNLQLYFKQYLPKYFASFVNSKINGKLYFGISDYGEITGIPCLHELSQTTILKYISNANKFVKSGHSNNPLKNKINMLHFVDVTIHSLHIDGNFLEDMKLRNLMIEMELKNTMYAKMKSLYEKEYHQWFNQLQTYNTKLLCFATEETLRNEMISFLELHKQIHLIPSLFTLKPNLFVKEYIHDPNTVWYWIAKYKDEKIYELQFLKPKKRELPSLLNYSMILSNLSLMRKRFSTQKVKYYLLEISVNADKFHKDNGSHVWFRIPYVNKWLFRTRSFS